VSRHIQSDEELENSSRFPLVTTFLNDMHDALQYSLRQLRSSVSVTAVVKYALACLQQSNMGSGGQWHQDLMSHWSTNACPVSITDEEMQSAMRPQRESERLGCRQAIWTLFKTTASI